MTTADLSYLTLRLSDAEFEEIARTAEEFSIPNAAKKFMMSAGKGIAKIVANAVVESLKDVEARLEERSGISRGELRRHVHGVNMEMQWNTPEQTTPAAAITTVKRRYSHRRDEREELGSDGLLGTVFQVASSILA